MFNFGKRCIIHIIINVGVGEKKIINTICYIMLHKVMHFKDI